MKPWCTKPFRHIIPVLFYFKEMNPSAAVLHIVSDGPTTQYWYYKIKILAPFQFNLGLRRSRRTSWRLVIGKAQLIRLAQPSTANGIVTKGKDILSGEAFFKEQSSIKLFYTTQEEIAEIATLLLEHLNTYNQNIPGNLWYRCIVFDKNRKPY